MKSPDHTSGTIATRSPTSPTATPPTACGPRHPAGARDVACADRHAHHRHAGDADGKHDRNQQELQARADAVAGQRLGAEARHQPRQDQHGQHGLQWREGRQRARPSRCRRTSRGCSGVPAKLNLMRARPEHRNQSRIQRAGARSDHQTHGDTRQAETGNGAEAQPEHAAEQRSAGRRRPAASAEGTRMLPVPRTMEASVLTSQMTTAPASATRA